MVKHINGIDDTNIILNGKYITYSVWFRFCPPKVCPVLFESDLIMMLFVNCVNISDQWLFNITQIPNCFSKFSLGASYFLGNGPMLVDDMVLVLDIL